MSEPRNVPIQRLPSGVEKLDAILGGGWPEYSFNLVDDGLVGQQLFAGETTRLAYMTDEAVEGKESFLEKRAPDWSPFPWYY